VKKNLLVAATAATLSLGALVPVAAMAQSDSTTGSSSIVDKLASKFSLNKADVQKVFDEEHAARQAAREQESKDELAALVKAGTLTQAQADKITAKRAEIKAEMDANRNAMQDKTEAERKAAMDAKKAEIDKWASDNGIDAKYLMLGHGGGRGHGGPHNG
jgi:membrane protein involved in colicin uptake